jgi:hypothetical protein
MKRFLIPEWRPASTTLAFLLQFSLLSAAPSDISGGCIEIESEEEFKFAHVFDTSISLCSDTGKCF